MNYDNYYKKGGMTQEELVSSIALRIGARKPAVAEFVEKNKIDADALNSDLKSGKVYFMDVITALVGKPDNKYQKEIIKKYGSKMAHGGKTQGYDDREDERLAMEYGKMSGKDFVGSHDRREHSRRDDARFEERMARGGYVSKGELVWKKLTNYERMKFLHENFTPEITPRSQEILVGKDYNFLPKKVKIVMESKYANVENYAKGGITREGEELTHYEPYFEKNVMVARIDEDEKIVRPTHGYFYPNKIGKKVILWAKKNGYRFIQDGKEYAKGGYMADGGEMETISHYKVGNEIFISYEDAMNYCDDNNLSYSKIVKTKNYAKGGYMEDGGVLENLKRGDKVLLNKLNKKVLQEINKANINTKLEMGQLVVSALTDANFHSKTRKFISILENKPEWAEDPKLDYSLPFEKLVEARSKSVYSSKYYDAIDEIDQVGRNIADAGWEFEPIVESLKYASQMKGLHTIADALDKLNVSDNSKNEWKYTDVDDIEYVIVKDKNGKELRFAGKYVLSGVHDLLAKGGKLSDEGKYYSKNNVVSVISGGKNIIDKNTVSGVWIMKDAKPMDEDVVDMKIGKTTIKKGYYGWVGKTMIDNFKGYDWDITTIKNYNGDLVTYAQGGKNKKEDGYSSFSFMMFQDPNIRLKSSRPARVTDKVVTEQHEEAIKYFKDNADLIAEQVDKIQEKKKMADGGAIGFDALAKKVAKNYEGDKVKKQYQKEYGKTYDKVEAEEVGKKVAAKVYRQQQSKNGKMEKGGKTSSYNRSESKMSKIAKKASEIRKPNEAWKDAFNRAKAMIS